MSDDSAKVWRDVRSELPKIDERVEVKGKYTPEGHDYPIAYRRGHDAQPCLWIYRDDRCGYTGELPSCDKTIADCRRHYGAGNALPFGGLPSSWRWESVEWRGGVGITHWRPIPRVKLEKLKGTKI